MKEQNNFTGRTKNRDMHPARAGFAKIAVLCGLLQLAAVTRTRAEDRADYRYEDYAEDRDRIHVQTHGFYFDTTLKPWLTLKGNYIHDAISGATPTGAPPLPGQKKVDVVTIDDIRHAGFIEPTIRLGNQSFTPQFSYSEESDYKSIGISLSHSIELNEKNTTVMWGASHSFDQILPNEGEQMYLSNGSVTPLDSPQDKDTTDVLLGVTQILGPTTIATANLTVGYSDGFLSDPYKRVVFDNYFHFPGTPYTVWPEHRPTHKFRQVAFLSLQQAVEKLDGAAELSYRFHHDDFGVFAHTVSVQWNQKIGRYVILSPLFRYYTQGAADFYGTSFPGDEPSTPDPRRPQYFSSDYRLSALDSFTYGVSVIAKVHEHVSLEFAYKRYVMEGTDGVTAKDQYPSAHVFTGGLTVWF